MPSHTPAEATEILAQGVETAPPDLLREIFLEIFPTEAVPRDLQASFLANHVRTALELDEIPDLWNVLFPLHHHVHYNEVEDKLWFNQPTAMFH